MLVVFKSARSGSRRACNLGCACRAAGAEVRAAAFTGGCWQKRPGERGYLTPRVVDGKKKVMLPEMLGHDPTYRPIAMVQVQYLWKTAKEGNRREGEARSKPEGAARPIRRPLVCDQ